MKTRSTSKGWLSHSIALMVTISATPAAAIEKNSLRSATDLDMKADTVPDPEQNRNLDAGNRLLNPQNGT